MSLKEKVQQLPNKPGSYQFKNADGHIIYIGKAKSLKKRVNSYFQKKDHDSKTKLLVKHIKDVDYIVTDTEVEALLLESKLIKKHQPKYNIDLKSGHRYAYIRVTDEEYPRLLVTRKKELAKKKEDLFGPFTSGQARHLVLELCNKMFQLRVCRSLPKKACLLYHINRCTAPCIDKVSKEEYANQVQKAKRFLKGDIKALTSDLEREMKDFSKNQQYEKAQQRLFQIRAINSYLERQKVSLKKAYNQDVINYVQDKISLHILVFHIDKGVVSGKKDFHIEKSLGNFEDFLASYYFAHEIPEEVILPETIADEDVFNAYLDRVKGKKVQITVPKIGDKRKLLDLVKENISLKLDPNKQALLKLQEVLQLPTEPVTIECFDISNIREKHKVGSMVFFRNGKPDKNEYRRFKIKTVEGQDDFACMNEVVYRRYFRLTTNNEPLPDLIVIDGGKGQLSGAKKALDQLGVNIPMIGLAKKQEEIFQIGKVSPLLLDKKSPELQLLQRVRDEAHRFAISYHRLLRKKATLT